MYIYRESQTETERVYVYACVCNSRVHSYKSLKATKVGHAVPDVTYLHSLFKLLAMSKVPAFLIADI